MILDCIWNKDEKCDYRNFIEFKSVFVDVCYMFNFGENGIIFLMMNIGQERGFCFLIDVQYYDYYYDVESVGFRVILYD